MTEQVVYVDKSTIREGKLNELEIAMEGLADFVNDHMPRLVSYGFFLNEQRSEMTVVAVHPDSASLEFHLDEGKAEFSKFSDLIEMLRIDVYGHVSDGVMQRLEQKARMLGGGVVAVHEPHAGFSRFHAGAR